MEVKNHKIFMGSHSLPFVFWTNIHLISLKIFLVNWLFRYTLVMYFALFSSFVFLSFFFSFTTSISFFRCVNNVFTVQVGITMAASFQIHYFGFSFILYYFNLLCILCALFYWIYCNRDTYTATKTWCYRFVYLKWEY